jgi:sensor histidine kinase YesM
MNPEKIDRYHIQLGLGVSLVITLIGSVTVYVIGKPTDHVASLLIAIARYLYVFSMWMLYVPVSKLLKNKLLTLLVFIIIGVLAILPLISYNLWVNEITNSFYPPFEDPADMTNPQENLFWSYLWRGVFISLLLFIIRYREELLQDKQLYLIANEKLKNQNLIHQLEVIKQQIDPHFLFNTLNALKTLIKHDPDKAERYAVEVSNVYRYLLRHNRNKTVLVKEELEFLQAYLSLLQLRFEGNLQIQMDIHPRIEHKMIFPLSLQLLVENAVKHNIVTKDCPLHVRIYTIGENTLAVENRIQLRSVNETGSQYGLAHLNAQYKLYDKEVEITHTADVFNVCLPLL